MSLPDQTYSIAGKQLKLDTAADVAFVAADLADRKDVRKIDFSGNTIGVDASEALAKTLLKHQHTLEEINLSDIYTSRLNTEVPQSLAHFFGALLQFPNLKTVNLSDNAFGLQTIEPIENYLAKAWSLEHLILSNNGMGPFSGERIGKSLYRLSKLKAAKGVPSLKTFVCGRNRLENGSMKYLTLGLINHKDLEELRLYQNGIRPIGIYTLVHGLKLNKNLKVLDLQDNTLTYLGCLSLSENLAQWTLLSELNLNDCLLKAKGFNKILDSWQSTESPNLTKLQLQYNELTKDNLARLHKLLSSSLSKLHHLEVNGNKLEDDDELIEHFNDHFADKYIDEMDEMEGEDSDEEDEEDDDEGLEDLEPINFEELAKELDGTEEEHDASVDEVADELSKTHIK